MTFRRTSSHLFSDVSSLKENNRDADPLSRIPSLPLRLASHRIIRRLQASGDGTDAKRTAEALLRLCTLVLSPEDEAREIDLELLQQLRKELLALWSEPGQTPPPSAEMVSLLLSLERAGESRESPRTHASGMEIVSGVAHDLRSPLTSILFLADTLRSGRSGEVNEIQHRQLGLVYSAALGLVSIASDMVELARGSGALVEREPIPFSVVEIMESVHDIVLPIAEEKSLKIRYLPPAIDQRLGYPVALSRVLLNLTTNGLKFTDEGFVEIVARARRASRIEFSVRDTGRGINPDAMDTLYQPFRTSHSGLGFSGTGLGLSICRTLVTAMGSKLQMETGPDWGTRFFFELDLPPASLR